MGEMSGQKGGAEVYKEVTGVSGRDRPGERGRLFWPNNGKSSWKTGVSARLDGPESQRQIWQIREHLLKAFE